MKIDEIKINKKGNNLQLSSKKDESQGRINFNDSIKDLNDSGAGLTKKSNATQRHSNI